MREADSHKELLVSYQADRVASPCFEGVCCGAVFFWDVPSACPPSSEWPISVTRAARESNELACFRKVKFSLSKFQCPE